MKATRTEDLLAVAFIAPRCPMIGPPVRKGIPLIINRPPREEQPDRDVMIYRGKNT